MTTSNQITLDHIKAYFALDGELEELPIAPTATGGTGINNIDEFPPPEPFIKSNKGRGMEYVNKYIKKENEIQLLRRQTLDLPGGSTFSVTDLNDVDDLTTTAGDVPAVNDLGDDKTQQLYETYYRNLNKVRDPDLTITNYRDEILRQTAISPIVIIQGPTGCGKTTQVPQYILDHYISHGKHCNIVVTQPRKLAAISIARRVCWERNWELGTLVGYQVAMDPKVSSDTRLCYMTTGVLLEKLVGAKRMDAYTHVIIDEIHERDQNIDFALLLVKKFLSTNSGKVKVILMSATFDTEMFAKYFSRSKGDFAPVIEVVGKSKEVTEHYLPELKTLIKTMPEFDIYNPTIDPGLYDAVIKLMYVFDRIEKVEQNVPADDDYAPSRGAVLIFLPGYEEISALTDKLKTARFNKNFWVIPLHSSVTVEEQSKVFRDPPSNHRKIIISTNIAESSITVPDVKYVIDFCLTKNLVTDPMTNYTCLKLEWASKANCIQRKGRAGRVDIGKVYRMVPKHFYDGFLPYNIPEIKRCPLTSTILHLKKLNLCEPQEMLAFALDPPNLSDIENSILQLKEALALTGRAANCFDGDLTFIGHVMSNLPLDIKLSKLIIFGYAFNCLEECIIIAASLSLQSFFSRPFQRALDAYRSRLAWTDNSFSDCLSYLNAYKMWKRLSAQGQFLKPGGIRELDWGDVNFIQIRRIKEVDLLIKDLKLRLEKQKIFASHRHQRSPENEILILKIAMAGAFFPFYYLQEELDEKEVMKEINDNDPHSTVMLTGIPPNHGLLYACSLRDMLSPCGDKIDIDFDERKAYVKFERNHEISANTVLQSVYLACKMRTLQTPLELVVFSHEEAERKVNQLKELRRTSSENRLTTNRFTVKLNPISVLKRVPLPEMSSTAIFITHSNNCAHFWARYATPATSAHLQFLDTSINCKQGRNLKPLSKQPERNMLCLAPYVDKGEALYYRCQIQDIHMEQVKVFFIDYGNVEVVNEKDLREIDASTPDVLNTPAMAFECELAEVKPSSLRNPSGDWCNAANAWFKKMVNGVNLQAEIYSIVQDIVRVYLKTSARDGTILNINTELINKGYAEHAEESYVSKQNRECRKKRNDYSFNIISMDTVPNQLEFSLEDAIGFSEIKTTNRKCRLHGPSNPLEVSYVGLTNLDRTKCIKVERDSVNSVSFNSEPQDPCRTMLIAANVSISQKSDQLCAKNTTLMPKVVGLASLICLMFSPYAEIRTDKERKNYIGALCGLGFDTETSEPLYADHDIEIPFDTKITLSDISDINGIRMAFNMLLQNDEDAVRQSTRSSKIHEELQKKVLNLLQKKRTPKPLEYFRRCGQWNQIPSNHLLYACLEEGVDCPHVLPLHKPSSLVSAEKNQQLLDHLNELYALVDENMSAEFQRIHCKLCSQDVTSTRELLLHLDSEKHLKEEQLLRMSD